jgi:transcriptional regulator with XRE-family HTH domain
MPDAQIQHLGAAIRRKRDERRWSRSRLAREIPVDPKTVERWEKGLSGGAYESLDSIAKGLESTPEEIITLALTIGREQNGNGDQSDEVIAPDAGEPVVRELSEIRQEVAALSVGVVGMGKTLDQILKAVEPIGSDLSELSQRVAP